MGLVLGVLLLIIILGALGFAIKLLWIVALVLLTIWLIVFVVRGAEGARCTAGDLTRALGEVQVRQVPVALVEVEAVADEEFVGHRESDVPDR